MFNDLILALILIFFIQTFFFALATIYKTDKFTDLAYGVTFVIIAGLYFLLGPASGPVPVILAFLISLWGIRLAGFLFMRILAVGRDYRFDRVRDDLLKFGGFWLLQVVTIWIILLPTLVILSSSFRFDLNLVSIFGIFIWAVGFLTEVAADQQKAAFRGRPENSGKWIQSGIWKYSRHPNYFGEMLVWWGIFLIALPFLRNWEYLTVISPIFITSLLLFVSGIPPLEKKADERFGSIPEYQNYKSRTSLLIPLPPKS
ncbi:MAG: DUF1295 domain-containing protein [Candidatus Woykebacteria bacterium]